MSFGQAVGQGFVNPGVFQRIIITGPNQEVLVYSGSPVLGNLIASIANTAGTDKPGNTVLAGITSYSNQGGGGMFAVNIQGDTITWFTAPAPNSTYTTLSAITALSNQTIQFTSLGFSGTINIPQTPAGTPTFTSLPNDPNSGLNWASGERAFMNTNWVGVVNTNFANQAAFNTAINNILAAAGIT